MGRPARHPTTETQDVPTELQGLVEFLEYDHRPTAVFGGFGFDQTTGTPLYENGAFKRLGLGNRYIERLLRSSDLSAKVGGVVGGQDENTYDLKHWRLTPVSETHKALVYQPSCNSTQCGDLAHNDKLAGPASWDSNGESNGFNGHESESDPESPIAPFDWTRGPVEDLSTWVEYVRTFDWGSTAIGPICGWPPLLRGYILHVMSHPQARLLIYGDERTVVYNEACIPLFRERHPDCLGKPASDPWCEIWDDIRPLIDASFQGKVQKLERLPLMTRRSGTSLEETYWQFVTLPMIGFEGQVFGLFVELVEVTKAVIGERSRNLVLDLRQRIRPAESLQQLWSCFLDSLKEATEDIPSALLYAAGDTTAPDGEGSPPPHCSRATLVGTVGVPKASPEVPESFSLLESDEGQSQIVKLCLKVWENREWTILKKDDGTLPSYLSCTIPGRGFGDEITSAVVLPITTLGGNDVHGVLILGLNPRRPLEEDYKMFIHFLSDFLIRAALLISLPQEQRRAQKIADDMNNALAQQLRLITLQAERTEAKFARMAAEAPTGVFVVDVEGKPLYSNGAYLRMLGETQSEQTHPSPDAVTWESHIHEDDLPRFQEIWHRAIEHKMPFTVEHRLKRPWISVDRASGQEISGETWLLANGFPELGSDGKITSIQGWLTDISHRKFTDSLVSRKLEEALENKRQTENFIDMTSHEMRNPLSAILQSADSIVSALEYAQEGEPSKTVELPPDTADEVLEAAQTIILCAQHQKRIVDDVLTMSKLDASLLVISPDNVQPPVLLEKAIRMFESEIERAGITATVDIEPTYSELKVDWVVLDPSRLLQVIINLLTNAIKFTQDAERKELTLYLGASFEKPTGKHHGVSFIPTKHIKRAESPLDDWGDGEILYLQIAVTDTGRGLSEDDINRLFQRFSQASPKTYKQYGGSGLGLFISRELCELQGGQIGVSSGNGKTTFTFFVRAKRWVPEAHAEKTHRPVLPRFTSTSASPMTYSRRGSVVPNSAGFGIDELRRVPSLREDAVVSAGAESGTPHNLSRQTTRNANFNTIDEEKLHVLVVEDNLINQKVMSQQLRRAGCVVHVANHGLECLSFIEKSVYCKAETQLSVILLDLEMPTMDGLTCIKHIRGRQENGMITSHIPVIAITANARSEQITMAIEAGMDQVVTKPFRIPELLPQMHALVDEVSNRQDEG